MGSWERKVNDFEDATTELAESTRVLQRRASGRPPVEVLTELMIRFSRGDRSAFTVLFALVWPVVLQYCRCLDDPEDAAQEVLLKVFSRIATFDCTRDGLAWILGIARFEALTSRKRRTRCREVGVEDLSWAESDSLGAEEAVVREEMLAVLVDALEGLEPKDKFIINDIVRCPTPQVADPRTRKRKQRAVERLQRAWRKLYES